MIKLNLETGRFFWIICADPSNHKSPYKRERVPGQSEKEKVLVTQHTKTHPTTAAFDDGSGHNPGNASSL